MSRTVQPSATDTRAPAVRARALRCNATQVPDQRRPKFPNTPWGKLRGARGWSLRDVEHRTKVNAGVLSRIERGIGPTPDQAAKLVTLYDLQQDPVAWLEDGEYDRLYWAIARARGRAGGSTTEDEREARAIIAELRKMVDE